MKNDTKNGTLEESALRVDDPSMEREHALIISDSSDSIVIRPLDRTHPECVDYWDGNWLRTSIEIRAGAFQGAVIADLRTVEFASFRRQLDQVWRELNGEALFESLEHWIELRIVGDGRGHFELRGILHDGPGGGTTLHFFMHFDQTSIPGMVAALDRIAARFPILGAADP